MLCCFSYSSCIIMIPLQRRRNTQPWLLERTLEPCFGDKISSAEALSLNLRWRQIWFLVFLDVCKKNMCFGMLCQIAQFCNRTSVYVQCKLNHTVQMIMVDPFEKNAINKPII